MTAISANGITIEYESHGPADSPAMILIRGLGSQMIQWPAALMQRLAGQGFHVVTFDNRDAGLSTKFEAAGAMDIPDLMERAKAGENIKVPYLLDDMAADVIGLMDALAIDTAHVTGISMGGAIAQVLAAKHGARLRSMTSIMAQSGNPGIPPGNRVPMLQTITIPCQVIHGTDDPLLNIAGGADTAANIPGADFHAIAGMGHETPAALAPVLADLIGCFARRVDEAAG